MRVSHHDAFSAMKVTTIVISFVRILGDTLTVYPVKFAMVPTRELIELGIPW